MFMSFHFCHFIFELKIQNKKIPDSIDSCSDCIFLILLQISLKQDL